MVTKLGLTSVLLVAAAACGPDASNYAYERDASSQCLPGVCIEAAAPPMGSDAGSGNTPLENWPDSDAGPLSGVFAMQGVVTAMVVTKPVSLRLLFRLRLLQTNGTHIEQSNTLCAFKLPSVAGVASLSIPPRLQTIIQENSVVVSEGDFLSVSGATQTYTPPPFFLLLGAKLKNPMTDPLPTMTDLTNEWDEDHDMHPGVTVDANVFLCAVGGVTPTEGLWVALRTGGSMTGTVTGLDTIDGTMAIFEEESVLGYSNACLSAASEITPKLSPSSPFHAQRLADESQLHTKGNVTCDDIIAEAPMLYGSAWAN
jgi:hypothetical protein